MTFPPASARVVFLSIARANQITGVQTMSDLPNVFDGPNFKPLPEDVILTLSNDEAAAYILLANAAALMTGADEVVTAAEARIKECVAKVSTAEKYLAENFAKPTFHDLWKANFSRK